MSGLLVMPGFIDAHTHMDMPFGGTITADDWDSGHGGGRRGRDDGDRQLRPPGHRRRRWATRSSTWQGKATGRTRIDYGLHVAICDLTDAAKAEIPELTGRASAP